MKKTLPPLFIALALALACVRAAGADEQPFAVTAGLSTTTAYIDQPIQLQILVQGTDSPELPDLPELDGFTLRYTGTNPRTERQVVIRQGRRIETVRQSAVLVYELMPKRAGRLDIPSLLITLGNKQAHTPALNLLVKEPQPNDDLKLRIELSREECYVGEPIRATWTFAFRHNLSNLHLTAPLLIDSAFTVPDYLPEIDPARRNQYHRLEVEGKETIAVLGQATIGGQQYTTLTFEKILIPRAPGERLLPASTVVADAAVGRQRTNDFFARVQEVVKSLATRSNQPRLVVRELPAEGRPANFAGHVGRYRIEAAAQPLAVNVGDPIELVVTVSGSEYLAHFELPPFEKQPDLARDFRLSHGDDPGEIQKDRIFFRRVLRATHPDVTEIPPLELPYFDTATGRYDIARTQPIPLNVRAARTVTALDAEGVAPANLMRKVKIRAQGLAANYEDAAVLRNQEAGFRAWLASPVWLGTLGGFPAAYFALAVVVAGHRRRRANPAAIRSRRARLISLRNLNDIHSVANAHERTLAAIRQYFGAKFDLAAGALTFHDILPHLDQAQVPPELRDELRQLIELCEAGHYAGSVHSSPGELIPRAADLIRRIDERIGR
ncbi:MAG: BatD family protein [Lentisphaeria bacterium]|jgi:hypothetical protein|nr:BatD family protein [Lentisphaeria bacterium]